MSEKIISNDELKAITGSNADDFIIDQWNQAATLMLLAALGTDQFESRAVTNEKNKILNYNKLPLSAFPVDTGETITVTDLAGNEMTGITWTLENNNIRVLAAYDSNDSVPTTVPAVDVLVDYTAGYTLYDTIKIDTQPAADDTITFWIDGTSTTYTWKASGATGNEINIGADANEAATNLATTISGSVSTDTVTCPLGTRYVSDVSVTAAYTVTAATIPHDLRLAVAYIAAGGVKSGQSLSAGDISKYTLGSKTVEYASQAGDDAKNTVLRVIDKYGIGGRFMKTCNFSI